MGVGLALGLNVLGLLRLDVGGVDLSVAGGALEGVEERPEEADGAESEHGPGESRDGSDARALVDEGAVLLGEGLDGVAALETVAEGGHLEHAGDNTEHDASSKEAEDEELVREPGVEDAEEGEEEGGEEAGCECMKRAERASGRAQLCAWTTTGPPDLGHLRKAESVVPPSVGVVSPDIAVLVELLRDETEEGEVDHKVEDEEREDEDLALGREERLHAGLGDLGLVGGYALVKLALATRRPRLVERSSTGLR